MTYVMNAVTTQGLSRRQVLAVGGAGVGLVTLSLAGCGGDDSSDGAGTGSEYSTPDPDRPKESPMLTELVDAGDLPPLEERLPVEADRLVIDTPEYGVYGGAYQGAIRGEGDDPWLTRTVGHEPMLRASMDLTEIGLPGTLKEIESNDDGTVYTLHLREGMRWSDGEPVTADDVMFAIDYVYFYPELHSSPPSFLSVENEPCTAERIDDYTVELTYPGPKGDVYEQASHLTTGGGNVLWFPKHYMEQFHIEFNEDAEEIAENEGFLDWVSYWDDRNSWFNNVNRPTLHAWVPVSPLNTGSECAFERNPFYWKVDADGAQLPYIDRMEYEIVQDDEVMLLKALNGEIDFHSRHFNSDANRPVLADGREEAGIDFVTMESSWANRVAISLNWNHQDEVLREIFQNKDFRVGLSHAINRQEIIDTVFQRRGEPYQVAPRPESEFYDEEFGKQFTDYDVDLANEYLDSAGLTERDGNGFRLRPDGDRLLFNIDVTPAAPELAPATDMVASYWQEVGVDARVNSIERTLFEDRKSAAANEHDAAVWWAEGGLYEEMIETRYWFPSSYESNYAVLWEHWYNTHGMGDHADEEPPAEPLRQMELYRAMALEPDEETRNDMFREILQIAKEQFYAIGLVLPEAGYGIARTDLRNLPESFADVVVYDAPAYVNPSTWFFDR